MAAGLALALTMIGGLNFVLGQRPGSSDHHAGLWGAFMVVVFLPFAVTFGLAGWAWHRQWRQAAAMQLTPLLALLALIALERWVTRLSAPPAP